MKNLAVKDLKRIKVIEVDGQEIRLVPLNNNILKKVGIPFSSNTLRIWAKKKRYPSMFVQVGGRTYIKLEEWHKIIKQTVIDLK